MIKLKFLPLALKNVLRHRVRSGLTIAGVACAMFLFCAIQAMQRGVARATDVSAADTTLVVYRAERFCPMTSRLPEFYQRDIAEVSGVANVMPMYVVPTNCNTSLDVVNFRGVPPETFARLRGEDIEVIAGSLDEWLKRGDAALLGETLAKRRALRVGDRFDAAGVTVYVAGILRSDEPQDTNVAYVHLPFLQQSTKLGKLGVVTQFSVGVSDPDRLREVGEAIDERFAAAQEPTSTYPEKEFVARAAESAVTVIGFTRWLGLACLVAVLALVGNAIVLAVQSRVRDYAVLGALGYGGGLIAGLIVVESAILALAGGLLGTLGAWAASEIGQFSLSNAGLSITMSLDAAIVATGLAISLSLGVLAGVVPAWQASRRPIAACFRMA
jgi:putative ABC transport system permease protein